MSLVMSCMTFVLKLILQCSGNFCMEWLDLLPKSFYLLCQGWDLFPWVWPCHASNLCTCWFCNVQVISEFWLVVYIHKCISFICILFDLHYYTRCTGCMFNIHTLQTLITQTLDTLQWCGLLQLVKQRWHFCLISNLFTLQLSGLLLCSVN